MRMVVVYTPSLEHLTFNLFILYQLCGPLSVYAHPH